MSTMRFANVFAVSGFVTGSLCATGVYLFTQPYFPVVIGIQDPLTFFLMPVTASVLAFLFARLIALKFPPRSDGLIFGALVASAAFISFILLLSIKVAGIQFLRVLPGFLFFGAIFVGWVAIIFGALTGLLVERLRWTT
jgi:hypothetical protein